MATFDYLKIRKKFDNNTQKFISNSSTKILSCNVISYNEVTKKAIVDLISQAEGGLEIPSLIEVEAGQKVKIQYKNKNNIILISKA
ncbi:hypothetical protein NSS82_19015 [Paenibacillus sp. FSL H7-0735]|uniref:hypothetical protein n=1 Tax=Paenibacillus sp. FSL H7-0735 TaxID=2954736 RepID=UPI0030F794B9